MSRSTDRNALSPWRSETTWRVLFLAPLLLHPAPFRALALVPPRMSAIEPMYIMLAVSVWIAYLEIAKSHTSDFVARKLCHAGSGFLMCAACISLHTARSPLINHHLRKVSPTTPLVRRMLLDPLDLGSRCFVWFVAVASIAATWNLTPLPPFRFSRLYDVGVTAYLSLVSAWFYLQLDPRVLAPVFFADPAGAVVGKWCSRNLGPKVNPAWYANKTVCGTAAVFSLTWATVGYPCSPAHRVLVAAAAALAEAVGGDYDNLALAAVVLTGWRAAAWQTL